jgi:predicted DNA-binding protein
MPESRTITIVIDRKLDEELTAWAASTGQDKSTLARDALIEWLEEQEDIRDAERIIAENNPSIPLEEVKRNLALDD